ncbi:RNA polymerase sigma factor [Pseudalkalibacillus sp. SCS-8]|uniref:RNA polymerase sigma factor n=1 Tax=Pseudalkalibacillus nanhaiensis TaxID=3115291 RepID=UPI0032DBB1BA
MEAEEMTIEDIYEKYYKDVYHFAIYFTNNRNEAEDITQDTFIKAMRTIKTVKDPGKVKVWILMIAKNTAIDYSRKAGSRTIFPSIWKEERSTERTPEEEMVHKDSWEVVQRALLKLKPKYRSVIILRGIKEYTIMETAQVLGIPELKVRVDYHRAMKLLKKEVDFIEVEGVLCNEQS